MVELEYFEKLDQEGRDLILKYRQKDFWKECHSLKNDEVLYEVCSRLLDFPPGFGRYDEFFYWNIKGKRYKPGKLLDKEPKHHEYWKYHLIDGKPVYVEYCQKLCGMNCFRLAGSIYVMVEDGYIEVDHSRILNVYGIWDKGDYRRYFLVSPRGPLYCDENEPISFQEYIVSKDRKSFDEYEKCSFFYNHTSFEQDEKDGFYFHTAEDSKYVKRDSVNPKRKPEEEVLHKREEARFRQMCERLLKIGFKAV